MTPSESDQHRTETIAQLEAEQAQDARWLAPLYKAADTTFREEYGFNKRRSLWRWLLSLLPLLLLISVSFAATYSVDQWGRVKKISDLPENFDVFIFVPDLWNPSLPRPGTPRPQITPAPTPCPKP